MKIPLSEMETEVFWFDRDGLVLCVCYIIPIKNWQAKVASAPACLGFKERFKAAGTRYDSAANGMFVQDMTTVWSDTKAAGCAAAV